MIPTYLLRHPKGPIAGRDITSRIEIIDHVLRFLDIELEMSEPIRQGYHIPDSQMLVFLRQRREEYVSLRSALTRVPPEIWKKIFSFMPSTNDVLACAQVSRIWRHAVLTMPRDLLKNVPVFLEEPFNQHFVARMTKAAFQNTHVACVLNAGFSKSGRHPKSKAMIDVRLALYRKSLTRLYISPQCVPSFFRNHLNHFWEGLHELVIDASDLGPSRTPNHLAEAVSLEPLRSLRRLTINIKGYLAISNITFPKELEYLHVDDVFAHSSDLVRALAPCTSLKTLILACHSQHWSCHLNCPHQRDSSTARMLFPQLRHLVLIGGDRTTALLSYFNVPALVTFSLASYAPKIKGIGNRYIYIATGDDIVRLVRASNCSIQTLELHSVFISDYDIGLCFDALRSLTCLKVYDNGGLSTLLKCLIHPFRFYDSDKPQPQVPNLTTLLVETTSPSDWRQNIFNGFVNGRKMHYKRCLMTAQLSHTTTLTPFALSNNEISNFVSSLKSVFSIAVRTPYLSA
jgi:hypothetical protein